MDCSDKYIIGKSILEVKDRISFVLAECQPKDEPILIEEGYENFNIIQYGNYYYGLPQDGEPFDPQKMNGHEYKNGLSGKSIAKIKKDICLSKRSLNNDDPVNFKPHLIEENYRGFNIIHSEDKYFGLARDQGAFDIREFQKNAYDHCYQAATADDIRNVIDKVIARSNESIEPILVEEDYRGYNIVLFRDKYYGLLRNGQPFEVGKT